MYAALVLPRDHVEPSESFDWLGMVLLSPGLALFLYGISTIPETGTAWAAKVLVPAALGLVLVVAFVPWALARRNRHPLVDLRLFGNRNLTVAVIAMSLFAMAFFGASLLFPLYFQEVRGETALHASLLLAPQGVGAMLTMPAAGILADRIGPGKIVLVGIVVITVGMGMFTQVDADTSYAFLLGSLFVMGLGMGGTMMPIMTSALQTLRDHTIARGSTLMNIVQQVAASMGTALFSVLLTNGLKDKASLQVAQVADDPSRLAGVLQRLGVSPDEVPALLARVPGDMADAFAFVFVVATVLVGLCLVPAFFLPRRRPERTVDPAAVMGH